jgi:hypothetical protein
MVNNERGHSCDLLKRHALAVSNAKAMTDQSTRRKYTQVSTVAMHQIQMNAHEEVLPIRDVGQNEELHVQTMKKDFVSSALRLRNDSVKVEIVVEAAILAILETDC